MVRTIQFEWISVSFDTTVTIQLKFLKLFSYKMYFMWLTSFLKFMYKIIKLTHPDYFFSTNWFWYFFNAKIKTHWFWNTKLKVSIEWWQYFIIKCHEKQILYQFYKNKDEWNYKYRVFEKYKISFHRKDRQSIDDMRFEEKYYNSLHFHMHRNGNKFG